ncbi:recombinase family protein [Kitasatospora sp. NPDC059812]|uniref:recombinase family protein n=1 Tax=Kitasatospora sp. NPDC059812 TaxID=3346958 RepID=UPI00365E0A58
MEERKDRATLLGLGFEEAELRLLGLWEPAVGPAHTLAEAYIRRSNKRDDVTTLREHVRDVVRQAMRDGKSIRHVWFEQRSASKAYVKREEFDGAVTAVLEGLSKTLYVWKTDRLSRRGMGQVGLLLDEFEKRGAWIFSVIEGLDSRTGRIMFAWLSERAREEAKDISIRTKIGIDAHKAEGIWPGGVTPYGLICVDGKLAHGITEYGFARPIAEALLERTVPAEIAADYNGRKIRTRKGKLWSAQGIINMAHSVSWAGLVPNRERILDEFGNPTDKYHRSSTPLMDADGHPVECGEGVVDYEEFLTIDGIFKSRSRPGTTIGNRARGQRERVAIIAGFFNCPYCGGPMGNGGTNYRCNNRINKGETACKGISVARPQAEAAMGELWLNHILNLPPESPTIQNIARRWLSYQDPAKEKRKKTVSAALDNAVSRQMKLNKEYFLGASKMDEREYENLRDQVAAQIEGMKKELEELSAETDLTPLMDPQALLRLWENGGVDGRRKLLDATLTKVVLQPLPGDLPEGEKAPSITDRMLVHWRDTAGRSDAAEAMTAVMKHRERQIASVA